MPIIASAKKAYRASLRKHVFNVRRKREMLSSVKEVKKAITIGNPKEAEKMLSRAYKAVDKAAKRGVIKKKTASRTKSRLVTAIRRAQEVKKPQ